MALPLLGAGIMAGAGLLGGLFTNDSNAKQQEKMNAFNAEEAQKQRVWQETLANSAYQRQRDDMLAAGLNPMLAAGASGGAGTPSGSAASGGAARMEDVLGKTVSSAIATRSLEAEVEGKEAQVALNKAQENAANAQEMLNLNSAAAALNQASKTERESTAIDIANKRAAAELPAIQEQAKADLKQARFNNQSANYDAVMKRVNQVTGIASDAASVIKPKIQIGPSSSAPAYDRYDPKTWRYKNRGE